MLAFTVKNYLSNLIRVAGENKYEIEFLGDTSGRVYIFNISREHVESTSSAEVKETHSKGRQGNTRKELPPCKVSLTVKTEDVCMRTIIDRLSEFNFKDETLTPINFMETICKSVDEIYECNNIKIHYPAQLYVKLFKLMRDRVSFMFRTEDDDYYYCYYVDGKILFVEETDSEYIVRGTNLYHLANSHPNYEILAVSNPLKRYMYGEYLDMQREIANKKTKTYVKIIKDKRVEDDNK